MWLRRPRAFWIVAVMATLTAHNMDRRYPHADAPDCGGGAGGVVSGGCDDRPGGR